MLGDSSGGAAAVKGNDSGGEVGLGSGDFVEEDKLGIDEGERSCGGGGGNRWPRQETLALLKIRSDMDVAFRDSSLKGPLWEEVSRKMAELGYQRNPKKCKEKFENVYKYHKRTKEGRSSKPDDKTYRFFDQLQALEHNPPPLLAPPLQVVAVPPPLVTINPPFAAHVSPLSTAPQGTNTPMNLSSQISQPPTMHTTNPPQAHTFPPSCSKISTSHLSISTSSSTSSDEDIQRRYRKKQKWVGYFERLMKDVTEKQEEMQEKFLETLEKREMDRIAREEAWRVQEMTKMNKEHELLVQERSIAAAKDSAVIAFLQKITGQQNLQIPMVQVPHNPSPPLAPPQQSPAPPAPPPVPSTAEATPVRIDTPKTDSGGESFILASSSRWPKAEVEALIKFRTDLDLKYQENGPKGTLWEEISSVMAKIGYNRSAKRCKEKWENMNKYFKKVKESNKKRPEDSKTCPYFEQLDAIYKEKAKNESSSIDPGYNISKPENPVVPLMAVPEQQWSLPLQAEPQQESALDEDGDDGDEDEGGGCEIVTNKQQS
ncbi:trihelix transcription factor GT-2-like [Olea europaea var. sylvestris]|uniref:Trihelix transcription factor GT-2-like n=1 Tax=Olea europaea subsp. europaea TaxID=158383 RepID=A0A8S0SHQ7_OLEEU|nr:trihelix transcription factor GT-2-like [Olea europaea var. sylvestris]CAA2992633.1 trihelix transcription factor GT-2-like [Olea europaea subsp. europaea]